ncbi:helix-turn-helix transcriptional regulator [Aquimarina gracilis]|uniref:Helix-turn-helix transcriptional regulator n=1 Tax=Aquimarina gracilis TaxID=874422 RepID=A0ABU5ZUQ3_9FLAO|nr:helix-turn-helix transcriptional regulator [Aquimarina gracilis]MEB3345393.1 helix-turn-helix transcriptional regulator [Aquimarina gracilis]
MSKIFDTCELSKNLIIAIYLIRENRFLYCNKVFESVTGYNTQQLICGGWNFLYSIIPSRELHYTKDKIDNYFSKPFAKDKLTLEYHVRNSEEEKRYIKHEILEFRLKGQKLALNYLFDVSDQEEIERCLTRHGGRRNYNFFRNQCAGISSREEEVLKLIANGFSSKQIADKLFISNHTAVSHRKHLIQKFQVKNTAQLIKEASKVLDL